MGATVTETTTTTYKRKRHRWNVPELSGKFDFDRNGWFSITSSMYELTYSMDIDSYESLDIELIRELIDDLINKSQKLNSDAVRDIRLYRPENGGKGYEEQVRIRGPSSCNRCM